MVEAPELQIEERRTPSIRARNETPPAGSVARRTRSKIEYDVGRGKKNKSKSLVIELHDSPVRDTSLSLTTPTVEAVRPLLVPTTEIVSFLSPDFEARRYRRKITAHRVKVVRTDVESSSREVREPNLKMVEVTLWTPPWVSVTFCYSLPYHPMLFCC